MYKVYYLTSEKDLDEPMYVGATKLSLDKRLIHHYRELSVKTNTHKDNWKKSRGKSIKICMIEDNITLENIGEREQYWINYYRIINPKLTNSKKDIIYGKKPDYTFLERKAINDKIEKALKFKNKSVVVLHKNNIFFKRYDKIIDCSRDLKIKTESIILSAKNKRQNKKYNFVYEIDYSPEKDYTYLNSYKRQIPAIISEKCRENNLKVLKSSCYIEDIKTGEKLYFDSHTKCAEFLKVRRSTVSSNIKRKSICKKKYYVRRN